MKIIVRGILQKLIGPSDGGTIVRVTQHISDWLISHFDICLLLRLFKILIHLSVGYNWEYIIWNATWNYLALLFLLTGWVRQESQ